jgi:CAAX prenyl protease-like protein
MMFCMRLRKILGIALVLAVLTAIAGGLSVLNAQDAVRGIHVGTVSPVWTMISRFVVVLVFGTFGLFFARQSQLNGSLFINSEGLTFTFRDVAIYGILPGLVLGLINYFFFFTYRYSPLVTPRIRGISTFYDSFVVSLDSGTVEEILYRLFFLSCFLFFFQHVYARLAPVWPGVVSILPKALSLVISSLLFAMVHNIYSFTAAFFGGVLLGLIYLRGGIESAIAAHFCANFLFFSASYLS